MPIVEIVCEKGRSDSFRAAANQLEIKTIWSDSENVKNLDSMRMYISDNSLQKALDTFQSLIEPDSATHIYVLPVDSVLPREKKNTDDADNKDVDKGIENREALYLDVEKGVQLDRTFILLVILSTIVVTIGLAENNIAIVIGAMVIAPLLGPNLGLALGIALGDQHLIGQSVKTNIIGLMITILIAILIGFSGLIDLSSHEVILRTDVRLGSIVLALASGTAAVLSLITGVSSVLVGVMVAVALLPPAAVFGMMLGSMQFHYAIGALLLLAVNVVCVNIAAQIVFMYQGIRPRTWLEQQKAHQSKKINLFIWILLLFLIVLIMVVREYFNV